MIDEDVVPRFFKSADIETQAKYLASALLSATCNPRSGPQKGTFGYQWYHTAKYFFQQEDANDAE